MVYARPEPRKFAPHVDGSPPRPLFLHDSAPLPSDSCRSGRAATKEPGFPASGPREILAGWRQVSFFARRRRASVLYGIGPAGQSPSPGHWP